MNPILTRRRALATLGGLAAGFLAAPVRAAAPPALNAEDRAAVARVEAYLNGVRSLKSRFIQTTSTGSFAEGRVYLERPGRLRLDYEPPVRLQVYSNGFWLIYVDHELQNVSQVPLSATPAAVLVAELVRLSGDIAAVGVERGKQAIRVSLIQTKEPDAGQLVLAFSDSPLQLREWTVVDAQGVETRVALLNPEFNVPVERQVFFFDPPPWAEIPESQE